MQTCSRTSQPGTAGNCRWSRALRCHAGAGEEASAEFAALVDRHHARYVAALKKLFEEHRDKFAKGEADLQLVE